MDKRFILHGKKGHFNGQKGHFNGQKGHFTWTKELKIFGYYSNNVI